MTLAILIAFITTIKKYKEVKPVESEKKIRVKIENEIPHTSSNHENKGSRHIGEKDEQFRQALSHLAQGNQKEKQEMNDDEFRNALKSLHKKK
ncbi:hypothetical protein [Heyndrickxia sporothermodurans]|uniref:Uncharacterized protein n=1 Tax=Heyndrickxia sporothermodurans TaxID=46224 RepID=A0A150L1H8_9BACI|nr:hypothetical protein [Heyndrickxia sporothermodurans]KYD05816.1 hypothetical protein B4102_3138 [Heyndrickxia sporothermodurans]MED3652637.1 hypothetical protein [Heyndrickxia sporothermodurans]MED3699006.1 hypothetical protein [Heyndrickxia sporothermodurans]